jgi:hypothetical protein
MVRTDSCAIGLSEVKHSDTCHQSVRTCCLKMWALYYSWVTWGCRSKVDETCVLLGCYATYTGNYLPTFRDKLFCLFLSDKRVWPLKMGPIGYPETSVRNYHLRIPDLWSWDRLVVPKRRRLITIMCCITSQKSADLILNNNFTVKHRKHQQTHNSTTNVFFLSCNSYMFRHCRHLQGAYSKISLKTHK